MAHSAPIIVHCAYLEALLCMRVHLGLCFLRSSREKRVWDGWMDVAPITVVRQAHKAMQRINDARARLNSVQG